MVTIRTKKQYERALEDLEDLRKARKKILLGGQSYTIGSNQLNRAALKEVNAEISETEAAIADWEQKGTTRRKARETSRLIFLITTMQ